MPKDEFEELLDEAEALTQEDLKSRISSLTRLTDAEIGELFPKKADRQQLVELMSVVRSGAAANVRRKQIVDGIEKYAGVVLTLLGKFV
jgi:hypothetical protein